MMPAFRHIVAATDFSEAGNAAAQQAFALCGRGACTLVLTHVIETAPAPNPMYAHFSLGHVPSAEQLEQMKQESTRALEALVTPEAREAGVTVRTEVRTGAPTEEIAELAKEAGADLVVVGDSGRGFLARAFVGSVADRLVHLAPCSVLVARKAPR